MDEEYYHTEVATYEDTIPIYKKNTHLMLNMNSVSASMTEEVSRVFDLPYSVAERLGMIVVNVLYAKQWNAGIYYSRDKNKKTLPKPYNKLQLSVRDVIKLVKFLEAEGIVTNNIAKRTQNKERERSVITATEKCVMMFGNVCDFNYTYTSTEQTVVVKDSNGDYMDIVDNEYGVYIKNNLDDLNSHFSKYTYKDKGGNTLSNNYRRVFNGDLHLGGRLYSTGYSVQRLKGEDRMGITINGMQTVEVDYVALHVALCLILQRKEYDAMGIDPYVVGLERLGISEEYRAFIKSVIMRMLNSKNEGSAIKSIRALLKFDYPEVSLFDRNPHKIFDEVYAAFHEIEEFFVGNTYGENTALKLQAYDAEIAVEIANRFKNHNKPLMLVHDSFVCLEDDAMFLCEAMYDCLQYIMCYDGSVVVKMKYHDGGSCVINMLK